MANGDVEMGDLLKIRKYQYASGWPVFLCLVFLGALHYHLWETDRRSALICAVFAFIAFKTQIAYKHTLICPKCGGHFYGPYRVFMRYTRTCKNCGLDFNQDFQFEKFKKKP